MMALTAALMGALLFSAVAVAAPGSGNSAATITGSFGDSCRDLEAHSSKDISHVEIHYADGRLVKDESIDSPDYSIDGEAGDEIDSAIVKSGTTGERLECGGDSPPVAVLERRAGSSDLQNPEGSWTSSNCHWDLVNNPSTTFCSYGAGVGEPNVSFRGTGSADPDGDIASWSIDFGDGTSAGGNWAAEPPADVTHDYGQLGCVCTVVLTVTDSAGQSSSDAMLVDLDNDGLD